MGRLDGKIALITGGARGQGAAEGTLFAAEGATVIITDVLDAEGEAMAATFDGRYLHHDVTDEDRWREVVATIIGWFGRVDVLVNNAGIYRSENLLTATQATYRQVIDINQVGVFLGMQAVAQAMIDQKSGSIVNISSIAGLRGGGGSIAYVASKFAVRGMTKSAAVQLAPHGVREFDPPRPDRDADAAPASEYRLREHGPMACPDPDATCGRGERGRKTRPLPRLGRQQLFDGCRIRHRRRHDRIAHDPRRGRDHENYSPASALGLYGHH